MHQDRAETDGKRIKPGWHRTQAIELLDHIARLTLLRFGHRELWDRCCVLPLRRVRNRHARVAFSDKRLYSNAHPKPASQIGSGPSSRMRRHHLGPMHICGNSLRLGSSN